MPELISFDLMRQVTRDAMLVYESYCHASDVLVEAQRAIDASEELINSASLVLSTYDPSHLILQLPKKKKKNLDESDTQRELLLQYVEIERGYALLKDALYCFMQACISTRDYEKAFISCHSLAKLDSSYRDVAIMIGKLKNLSKIFTLIKSGKPESVFPIINKQQENKYDQELAELLFEAHRVWISAKHPKEPVDIIKVSTSMIENVYDDGDVKAYAWNTDLFPLNVKQGVTFGEVGLITYASKITGILYPFKTDGWLPHQIIGCVWTNPPEGELP